MLDTISSASSSRPWMISQRGDSGTWRRTSRTARPSTTPRANDSRQPTLPGKIDSLSATIDSSAPSIAPNQNDPLIARSTRPRCLDGISSSMAELIAAYSPPMPKPVRKRQAKNHHGWNEIAVSAVATR